MMIDRTDPLPVGKQAKLLGISRGTVYYLPRATSPADLALMRQIDQLHLEHPFMGQRMLVRQLKRQGVQVGRVHVRTLMQRMGICAMAPQPGTSRPAPGHKIYPYLLRNVRVTQANHVWALDTTYIPMEHGFVYLTAVVDVASRRVLAHKVATTLEACHAAEVMNEALGKYGKPEIVTRIKVVSSRPPISPTWCYRRVASSAWTGVVPGETTSSWNACGAPSSTSMCTSMSMPAWPMHGP